MTLVIADTFARPRAAWVDKLRGLAVVLMVGDHVAALAGSDSIVLRHGLFRLSLPLFMVAAAVVWRGGPSSRRLRHLGAAAVAEVILSTVILRLDGPGPVVLYALVLVIVAPRAVHEHPGAAAILGIVQALYLPIPWAGYQPGLLLAYWSIGRLARAELEELPVGWLPGWLGAVGRRPLGWYVGHLAALVVLVELGALS